MAYGITAKLDAEDIANHRRMRTKRCRILIEGKAEKRALPFGNVSDANEAIDHKDELFCPKYKVVGYNRPLKEKEKILMNREVDLLNNPEIIIDFLHNDPRGIAILEQAEKDSDDLATQFRQKTEEIKQQIADENKKS